MPPGSRPRLLVLTSTFPRWVDDHEPPFVFELARRLTGRFAVTVLAPHAPGAARHEVMDGVEVQRFVYAPPSLERLAYEGGIPTRIRQQPALVLLVPLFVAAQLFATVRLLWRLRPAAIHAHWLLPQGLVASIARRLGGRRSRLVVTAHGADVHGLRSPLARWAKRHVLQQADAVAVASVALGRELQRQAPGPWTPQVLPMGIDLQSQFVPGPAGARRHTLLFCGRLVRKKGIETLVRAFPAVLGRHPAWRLIIAGGGPERGRLEALRGELGLDALIRFTGPYRNAELPALLAQSDIAVFPFEQADGGDQEGLGLVMVEAMGCGLPVVAGDVPAVHDVIHHERTGLLTPPRDPAALADAILRLIGDEAFATSLAERGRAFVVERFDWAAVADRYCAVLRGSDEAH